MKTYVDISQWIKEDGKLYSNSPPELEEAYEYIYYTVFEEDFNNRNDWALRVMYHAYKEIPRGNLDTSALVQSGEDLRNWLCELPALREILGREDSSLTILQLADKLQREVIKEIYEMVGMDLSFNEEKYADFLKQQEEEEE